MTTYDQQYDDAMAHDGVALYDVNEYVEHIDLFDVHDNDVLDDSFSNAALRALANDDVSIYIDALLARTSNNSVARDLFTYEYDDAA